MTLGEAYETKTISYTTPKHYLYVTIAQVIPLSYIEGEKGPGAV